MGKDVKFADEAVENIVKGIDIVADIVKTTLGPSGRNVVVRNQISPPIITNDGVTIAQAIQLKDNSLDTGAQLIISASKRTNEIAGDGTTTTTLLAQEMIHKYYEYAKERKDINPVMVKKDMILTANEISDYLKSTSVPVKSNEDIKRVATISSGDESTGEMIARAFESAGDFGSVVIEDSKTGIDNIVSISGMKIPNGMVNPFLFTDRANQKSDTRDVQILVIAEKLDNALDVFPIIEECVQSHRKLLIMCDDVGPDVINMIVSNKIKGVPIEISIVRLPGFGELRESLISDICLATGSTLISRDNGSTIKDYNPSYLGEAEQVTITRDDTIIKFKDINSNGANLLQVREDRVEEIKTMLDNAKDSEKEQYKRRISNLISGITIFEVGGNSDVELKERKLRIEDAINSVQSAKEEGIVAGGGYSFLSAIIAKSKDKQESTLGQKIVYEAMEVVTKQIAENAGYDGPMTITECYNKELGFNALTGEYENLLDTGVINSVKVDRYSLINATSLAATVITMGGYVVEENEPESNVFQLQAPIGGVM